MDPWQKIHWQLLEGPIRLDILQFSGHDSKWCDMYSLLVAAGKVSQRGLSEQGTTNGGYEQEGSIDTYQTWWFPSLRKIEIIKTIHIGPHEDYWYFLKYTYVVYYVWSLPGLQTIEVCYNPRNLEVEARNPTQPTK